MFLTVKDLYNIAEKMTKDNTVINNYEKLLNTFCENKKTVYFVRRNFTLNTYVMTKLGNKSYPMFEKQTNGDNLILFEKNGRIYYYIQNSLKEYAAQKKPITDKILKQFTLTKKGEELIKEYYEKSKIIKY